MDASPPLQRVQVGPFEVDLAEGVLRNNGNALKLQDQSARVLMALLERPGQVVTREELRRKLWPEDTFVEFDDGLNHAIQKLREALGDSAETPAFVETVPRRGYRLIAPVEAVEAPAPRWTRYWQIGIAAAVVILLAVGGAFYVRQPHPVTEKDEILLADFVNSTGDQTFNGALKAAVAAKLEESPFLNVVSDGRAHEILQMMQKADEKLVGAVAREACRRLNVKAVLNGAIEKLGSEYVIELEAVNCGDGETLTRVQVEAATREQVLRALGQATSKLRAKLGESIRSVRKYDTPLEQATTSSLEALQEYSLGWQQHVRGKYAEAIPYYQRAIELDPNFALAHLRCAQCAFAVGDGGESYLRKAFELRERVSQREKYQITGNFHMEVTGELNKAITAYELLQQNYPRDHSAPNNLGVIYFALGLPDRARAEAQKALELNPDVSSIYDNLALSLMALNRGEEAAAVLHKELENKATSSPFARARLYELAAWRGDGAAMEQIAAEAKGTSGEAELVFCQAQMKAFGGQLRQARRLYREAGRIDSAAGMKHEKLWLAMLALTEAEFGNQAGARDLLAETGARGWIAGLVQARTGEIMSAKSIADEIAKQFPLATGFQEIRLPLIYGAIELQRGNPAAAVERLRPTAIHESRNLIIPYLRGQAHLGSGAASEAIADFRSLLDHRGIDPTSPLYPLAYVGLARARALAGDKTGARQAYEQFFLIWKDADSNVPILRQARAEYARLRKP